MRKTFASYSFGCRVNQAEVEELNRQLTSLGYSYDQKQPSFYIINTCSVTAKAERETRQYINQMRRKYPKTKIIITGCTATKWIMDRQKNPNIDWMIDNREKEDIAQLLSSKINNQKSKLQLKTKNLQNYYTAIKTSKESAMLDKYLSCGRMILKIQDGCQRFCSYCIVPYLRGKPKSVRIKNLESRIMNLEKEIKEVILTAINTEAYGLDTGETFNDLIKAILNKTKIERLSFGSIHPWSINSEFIQLYKQIAGDQRFIDFFHIPLQSGSNKILNLMKRNYTREEFMEKLNIINKINSLAFIGTDIIVGFLDETDRDFEDTYKFLSDSPICKFHIFRFSIREKTAAYFMAKRLKEPSPQKKLARAKILSDLGKKKYQQFLAKHLYKTFPALFLSRSKDGLQWALLDNQIPAVIDTEKKLAGDIKRVKINSLKEGKLLGKID